MTVYQAVNTSEYDNINGMSCHEYWKRNNPHVKDSICFCRATSEYGTEDDPIVGGHVIGLDNGEPHVYITPILNSVNKKNDPKIFNVDEVNLVQVPTDDEKAILSDKENQQIVRCLEELSKLKRLMMIEQP